MAGWARGVCLSSASSKRPHTGWHWLNKGVHSWLGLYSSRVSLLFTVVPPHPVEKLLTEKQPRDQQPELSLDNRIKNFLALATTKTVVAGSSSDTGLGVAQAM